MKMPETFTDWMNLWLLGYALVAIAIAFGVMLWSWINMLRE